MFRSCCPASGASVIEELEIPAGRTLLTSRPESRQRQEKLQLVRRHPVQGLAPAFQSEFDVSKLGNASSFDGVGKVFSWFQMGAPVGSPCYETLHKRFPGALPGLAFHSRIRACLEDRFGFTPDNTLFGTSVCPDEINNEHWDLVKIMDRYWGACFPMGGIGGAPFVGKSGFSAFAHHVPENGNIIVVFGPHVAISESGEVGKYLRFGQRGHSTACGACIGAYNACISKTESGCDGDGEVDHCDMQIAWLKSQIEPHVNSIREHEEPMAALAYQAFMAVKEKLMQCVHTNFGSGRLILIGGVQINMPAPAEDHFMPLFFEARQAGKPNIDMMGEWFGPELQGSTSKELARVAGHVSAKNVPDERLQQIVFSWMRWAPVLSSPCYDTLHRHFPGALPGHALHGRLRTVLEAQTLGFTPRNTLVGTSVCPDEINNETGDLVDLLKGHWGACFPMGGISGAPFVGKTGFKAFSHHVPENGNVLVVFAPHVAISESGEIGKYLREGQVQHSTACGAVIGAYCACSSMPQGSPPGASELEENDMQMAWIKRQIQPHYARLAQQENPMAALARQSFEMVREKLLNIADTSFGSGHLAIMGGIMINMPKPCDDHFLPCMFTVQRGAETPTDMMPEFGGQA